MPRGVIPLPEVRRLLQRAGHVDPRALQAYLAAGGGRGLGRARELGPERMRAEVARSGLVGRGGAAFPSGTKWAAVASAPAPRWVVCNADESEPGTFKDRTLLEQDPFSVLEGLLIAALSVGAEQALVYVRGEYDLAATRLEGAIAQVAAAGLAPGIRLRLFRGAGAYICGEETALFNSVEGRRGEPRSKPPFPTESGLFGRPTLVGNVETLANVTLIAAEGAEAFRRHGTERSPGTKLFCVSGQVTRPGVYEVALGTPLGELVALAGGVWRGRRLQAVLCGGAAGAFLGPEHLDVPLSFEGLRAVGAPLGSGAVIVLDETADVWRVVQRVARFFREESCGQCVPCRIGTQRQMEIVDRLAGGRPRPGDAALLRDLAGAMADASICGLGQSASTAVQSALALRGEGEPACV